MAYNSYYPQFYQPVQAVNPMSAQTPPSTQQMQSSFVSVRSESEARNYPVAYGNSVTFKDENAPYIYTKTMGFSQLDRPTFDKYKLVKESPQDVPETSEKPKYDNDVVEKLQDEIKAIWSELEALKKKPAPATKKGGE